jgi:gamma-glutamylcyclotransferase (GGCT)/AIG2-like uncharacterized protein YtfP
MEMLFAYGTLQDPEIQREVCGRIWKGRENFLFGYTLSSTVIEGETFPSIMPDVSGVIGGMVCAVASEDLLKADVYEGSSYRRIKRRLASGDEAWVYVPAV